MTKLGEVEELLRRYPLYNSHGPAYPRNVLRRAPVPQIKLQPLQPSAEMFAPWYRECDDLVKYCEAHDKAGELFDQWYSQQYMSNKPPGMVGNAILSPSRRD